MISGLLSAELSATCNALGYSSGSTYYTDPYVKETITDLIRYLRRDDEEHTIRRHLGSANVLQTDLLPILVHHSDREELFDALLRLLVNLTNPALLMYQEEVPAERTARHYFLQLISQLQTYKEAFAQQSVWEVLAKKLGDLLQIEYHERDEDQSRTMERILILARNVLQAPADPDLEKRPDNDASVHDQVLWSLHQAGMVDLFLYIATTDHEQQYYMHILEIVSLMLREQKPATLASAALQRSVEERELDEKELLNIRQREIAEKRSKVKKYAGSRHSRFGGTFIVKDVKSISDRDLIFHKPLSKATTLTFDLEKQKAKVPKNKVSLSYHSSERRSAFSVRLFLKEFCVEFLNGAYNPLMYKVRENLVRAVGQPNDETYYFWAMKFFMEFNRLYKFQVKLISETMHQQIFHFVQTQMESWLENMVCDKKKIPVWSRRIHQALKAYQELLMTLQAMDKSPEQSVRESARVIKSNVFYQSEYRELVIFLFNVFTETKFSRTYLKDLVETTHIFLKMLEHFCSRHQNLIVQGKPRKKPKKKKAVPKRSGVLVGNLEAIWEQVGPELSAVLQGEADIPSDIVPFDAASDLSMDQQKVEAMKKIQSELKQGNFEQAVGLLRASREVWPENNNFGHANMAVDEEFLAMREIFMTDIGQPAEVAAPVGENGSGESEDDEEDPRNIVVPEQSFKFIEFVVRFACPRVLSVVSLVLEQFETNTAFTNHCAIKILHRVAWECKMPAMMFQASLFRTFQRVFKSTNPEHKEIAKFAIYIMRKFAEMAQSNKKIYMELLFWKNRKEADELEVGYGNSESKSHSVKNVWREEQEDELRRLAAEYERDTPEPDAVDWIMKNMIDQTRSRRAVIKKMKELYLVVGKIKPKSKLPKEFSDEEVAELTALFEQYKDAPDPMNCILGRLSVPRSRKAVADKLLDLGVITDKKQLRKKSKGKSEKSAAKDTWGKNSDDESIYDSWSDNEGGSARSTKKKKTKSGRLGQPSVPQMCCHLRRVLDADLREPLEWLLTSLQEVLEDLADAEDDDEGIALLPLTAPCVQAMENPTFLQLLDILSVDKPTDQEVYWRIPGRWKAEDLTKRINLIKDALEGRLPEIDEDEVEDMIQLPGIPSTSTKLPIQKKKRLKKKSKKTSQKSVRGSDAESGRRWSHSTSSSDDETTETSTSTSKKEKIVQGSESDEYSNQENGSDTKETSVKNNQRSRNNSKVESSSEEENNIADSSTASCNVSETNNKALITTKKKKIFKINSDSENEIITSTQKNDADEDSPENSSRQRFNECSDSENDTPGSNKNTTNLSVNISKNLERIKRKRPTVQSDSDDEKNTTVSTTRTSVSSPSQQTKINNTTRIQENVNKRKRLSIDSGSDDERSKTINSTNTSVTSQGQTSEMNNSSRTQDIVHRRKRLNIDSESDDERSKTINSTNTSVTPQSQTSEMNNSSRTQDNVHKRKRINIDSESDDERSKTINSTNTSVTSQSQTSEMNNSSRTQGNVHKRKRLNIDSESDDERSKTINSTNTSVTSQSQRSKLKNSTRKRFSIDSESDDESTSENSTNPLVTSKSQRSEMNNSTRLQENVDKRKRLCIDSESDDERNTIINSTNTSVTSQSQRSEMNNSSRLQENVDKRKRLNVDSESDDERSTTINSTNTSVTSQSQRSEMNNSSRLQENVDKRKRLNIDSESDDERSKTINSTNTSVTSQSQTSEMNKSTKPQDIVHKRKRISIDSESDDERSITINSTNTSVTSQSQTSEMNKSTKPQDIVHKRKRISIDSESDDERSTTINSTIT